MSLELFEHNQRAYESADYLMNLEGKAAVIHPTGTGKSFIAFKLAEQHGDKRIVWMAPSEYIYQTQVENLKKVVSEEESEEILSPVNFVTYSKLMMNEEMIEALKPDYIILDEFHRCGAPEWGSSVRKLLEKYPDAKLLGLSATNIRFLDNQRDMAQEIFDGVIASEMSLGEAIARHILPAPKYVVSMYSYQDELERIIKRNSSERNHLIREENDKLIEQLRRALENAEGLDQIFARHMKKNGKYLVFCANKEHMREMVGKSGEWFAKVDANPHIYDVYYDNPATSRAFADFKEDSSEHLRLLFSIDMLNEGVHVDDIDGVILLRPTVSPTLYLQQIGRALTAGSRTNDNPVIFDIVNNFDGLYSVDALREEFREAIFSGAGTPEEKAMYSESFRIIDEVRDCRELFALINYNLSATWDIYYQEAQRYFEKYKDLAVVKSYVTESGLNLGSWLQTQRRVYAGKIQGHLSAEQIRKLEAIDMKWESRIDQKYEAGIEALKSYIDEYGDTDVPTDYVTEKGYRLGRWVANARLAYKNGRLEESRINELSSLGMIWDVRAHRWLENYREAKKYFEVEGNLWIPVDYVTEKGVALGRWLANQRDIYNRKKLKSKPLTNEQIGMLEGIGICWGKRVG